MSVEDPRRELVEIVFLPSNKHVEVKLGTTVLDAARLCGVHITAPCNGLGKCGKCKVKIQNKEKTDNSFSEVEIKLLSSEDKENGYRLACELRPKVNTLVTVPRSARTPEERLQTSGIKVEVQLDPSVKKYFVRTPKPSLQDPRSDEDRLLNTLQEQHGLKDLQIDLEEMRKLPVSLRKCDGNLTVTTWYDKLIMAMESGNTTDKLYGFAIDVGTTKLAGFLVDLGTGELVESKSILNPQLDYGEDVMTRIAYVNENQEKLAELQKAIVKGINRLITSSCKQAKIAKKEICELTVVGNTCMQTLLLGILPKYLGLSPYPPPIKKGVHVKARLLGIKSHQNANLYVSSVIGGFVGGDSVAAVLSSRMLNTDEMTLLIDVGTNSEIVLGNKNDAIACSCPSGPAFEGHHIKHGVRAVSGAIERIAIDQRKLEVRYTTINGLKPVGVCGSALIDIVAEFLKAGIIDATGRFNKEIESRTSRMRRGDHGYEFILAFSEETDPKTDIVITQADIREFQKAKAAIFTGAYILMQRSGVTNSQIDSLLIAGAFGNYVDPENARIIGMYPEIPLEKIAFIGNAAGTGAQMILKSKEERKKSEEISRRVKYIELSMDPAFAAEFGKAMYLPNKDLNKFPRVFRLLERRGNSNDAS